MSPEETLTLLRVVRATFPGQHLDEYTPDAWHRVLGRFDFADCETAVFAVAQTSSFCSAADIADRVRKLRAPRLEGINEIQPPSADELDPDDWRAFQAWQRQTIADVASGRVTPPKPLPAGQPSAQMRALLSGVGRRVPRESR